MRAQVLTYSRARGVFAGLALDGAVIKQDRDDTRAFYGRMVPYRSLLQGLTPAPSEAEPFLKPLGQYAPISPAPGAPPAKPAGQ
jgi:lipid-binding SYLF domain-containing protein